MRRIFWIIWKNSCNQSAKKNARSFTKKFRFRFLTNAQDFLKIIWKNSWNQKKNARAFNKKFQSILSPTISLDL